MRGRLASLAMGERGTVTREVAAVPKPWSGELGVWWLHIGVGGAFVEDFDGGGGGAGEVGAPLVEGHGVVFVDDDDEVVSGGGGGGLVEGEVGVFESEGLSRESFDPGALVGFACLFGDGESESVVGAGVGFGEDGEGA